MVGTRQGGASVCEQAGYQGEISGSGQALRLPEHGVVHSHSNEVRR
jgi:hypothetical protein